MQSTTILRILSARVVGPHELELEFNDGATRVVNVRPLLEGPIFRPLQDPGYFARVSVDPVCGTVVWPNGADFAPEALRALESETGEEEVVRDR
ncbi:MAG: DUF2442 domain-containing protein [Acidobacteriota bacterium]|jgi:hypothetical protein